MRKRETTFPLTPSEKNDAERAKVAFNKALRDAGAGHVVPMLRYEFAKTMPVTHDRSAEYRLTIMADDTHSMLDHDNPAVLAVQSLAQGDVLPGLKLEDDPVRVSHSFIGHIDLQTPKIVRALRNINIPKASI